MAKIVRKNTLTPEKTTIRDAYELFLGSRKTLCAEQTYKIYCDIGRRHIIPSLTSLANNSMDEITAVVLRASINDYAESHTNGGKWFYYRHLKSFINWYWEENEITTANPIKKIRGIKKPNTPPKEGISRDEIDKLLKAAKSQIFPERDTAMLMILCDTGIRFSSMMGLKIKDIDISKSQLLVFEKDQNFHIKSFGSTCAKAIKKYLNCLEDIQPSDSFWLKMDGTPLSQAGMKQALRRLCKDADIPLHLFHDFRRFYGLELYKSTHDIYFVSRALDHKDIEVTKRYLAIDNMEDAEALRSVSPMDNKGVKIKRKR